MNLMSFQLIFFSYSSIFFEFWKFHKLSRNFFLSHPKKILFWLSKTVHNLYKDIPSKSKMFVRWHIFKLFIWLLKVIEKQKTPPPTPWHTFPQYWTRSQKTVSTFFCLFQFLESKLFCCSYENWSHSWVMR